jgi:hypothetical protein
MSFCWSFAGSIAGGSPSLVVGSAGGIKSSFDASLDGGIAGVTCGGGTD